MCESSVLCWCSVTCEFFLRPSPAVSVKSGQGGKPSSQLKPSGLSVSRAAPPSTVGDAFWLDQLAPQSRIPVDFPQFYRELGRQKGEVLNFMNGPENWKRSSWRSCQELKQLIFLCRVCPHLFCGSVDADVQGGPCLCVFGVRGWRPGITPRPWPAVSTGQCWADLMF